MPYVTGQVGEELSVSAQTIRTWCKTFSKWLSDEASAAGRTRLISDDDLIVLRFVASQRQQHLSYDQIAAHLTAGERLVAIEEPPPEEPAPEVEEEPSAAEEPEPQHQPGTAIITMAQVQMMLAPISAAADEWRSIASSRQEEIDHQREELEALRAETHQLRAELGQARRSWWQKLLGR